MNERLEIDALRALLAIATYGGVTRAARHLALSQSAVSHKIGRLERALNCKLLTRRKGAPLFTEDGLRLCEYARRITTLHDEAVASLGNRPLTGHLRLGMTEDATTSGIAQILGRFTRLYPDVRVRTRTGQSLNVQDWLKSGELDLAVIQIFRKDVQPEDLILFQDSLHWVKSPDYRLNLSEPVPFLSFDTQCFYRRWGMEDSQQQDHRFDNILECPSAAGIQSAVRSGLGIALLNGMHITPDMEVINDVFPTPPELAYVARVQMNNRNAVTKALIAEIAKEVERAFPLHVAV
ncbi:LysR family transcriptional regulator [Ruegeria faecimaris]|uniref:DNA-binding transcriptional regulator, LysR family n=1 Tax=Ruegeria faecimaris TaxID=686389 RepID=A0A521BEI4_9RHOB|nr:LysR family transcriptional regulator [Ruegeria faecimaris]SMO45484.1 DNA-binding transcriptional regulator, LysR family [Ruegeria faecimaris]